MPTFLHFEGGALASGNEPSVSSCHQCDVFEDIVAVERDLSLNR